MIQPDSVFETFTVSLPMRTPRSRTMKVDMPVVCAAAGGAPAASVVAAAIATIR
jgi:hypothetical protein